MVVVEGVAGVILMMGRVPWVACGWPWAVFRPPRAAGSGCA